LFRTGRGNTLSRTAHTNPVGGTQGRTLSGASPSTMDYAARRERLIAALDPALDALLVSHSVNIRYLTGFAGEASFLVASRSGTVIVSDARFTDQIADEAPDVPVHIRGRDETTLDALAGIIEKYGLRNVGIEANRLTVADFDLLKDKLKTV